MINQKINTPSSIFNLIPYNLFDFIKNFENKVKLEFKSEKNSKKTNKQKNNVKKKSNYYLKNGKNICPHCGSKKVIKFAYKTKKLVILNEGKVEVKIQRYKCKICNKIFNTDLSNFVLLNCNITIPVIETIRRIYSIHGSSIYKIKYGLKKQFKVDISHQSIENVIKNYKKENKVEFWSYSGYYLFDSIWTKINDSWKYILALFDVKQNTLVSFDLASNESKKTIKKFLGKSTRN